jgi:tetratricopeptide (TPR) repeat protein
MLKSTDAEGVTPSEQKTTPVVKPRRWLWFIVGILLVIIITAIGSYMGYQKGIQQRLDQQFSEIALIATTQFQLGLQDMQTGNFELARKRFEYVIQIDSKFPGAAEKLVEVSIAMSRTETPTAAPSATPSVIPVTPTVDTRGAQQLFTEVVQLINNKEWQKALDTLEALRQNNKEYRTVEVDGLYYIVLRNLGVHKILIEGELEQGIYDLALAERFGPLDAEAASYRTWAQYYTTGATFWQIDWSQVVRYFSEVYPALPNLRDGGVNGMTATERYRLGSIYYGDKLAAAGDFCKAKEQYQNALALSSDAAVQPTASYVTQKCEEATPTSTPNPAINEQKPTPSITPSPLVATPTKTPPVTH